MLTGALIVVVVFVVLVGNMILGSYLGPQGNWIGDFEQSLRDNGEI